MPTRSTPPRATVLHVEKEEDYDSSAANQCTTARRSARKKSGRCTSRIVERRKTSLRQRRHNGKRIKHCENVGKKKEEEEEIKQTIAERTKAYGVFQSKSASRVGERDDTCHERPQTVNVPSNLPPYLGIPDTYLAIASVEESLKIEEKEIRLSLYLSGISSDKYPSGCTVKLPDPDADVYV